MKKSILLIISSVISYLTFAQSPQLFQYQAVVRDVNGVALQNQSVGFQLSIISGSPTGTIEYVETHTATTNNFGIVTLIVGGGTTTDNFAGISWGSAPHFLKVEADLGSGYLDMGTTQLLSVPYALYSENAGNVTTYIAGSGISITGNVIDNISPDQIVNITGSGATSVTGTYPNFTISSTDNINDADADPTNEIQILSISNDTLYLSNGGSVFMGNYSDTLWKKSGNSIYNTNSENVGVGINNPVGRMVVQGSPTALATDPLFEVKNSFGQSVFVVWQDSVQVFINDETLQSNRGGFAVSGRNTSKAFTNNYLKITPDSTRIWTKDTLTGFGVQNINGTNKTSYMQLTPNNYFIGHEAGLNNTSGFYNSFIGFKCGKNNTSGLMNTFMGYLAGLNNDIGQSNVFIGLSSGMNNTSGGINTFVGTESGYSNTTGSSNTFVGSGSGHNNTNGSYNTFLGMNSGMSNIAGTGNTFLGSLCGAYNTSGNNNLFVGNSTGTNNTIGNNNVFLGPMAGFNNLNGDYNIFIGNGAGYYNTSGGNNIFMGDASGFFNTTGADNICIGRNTGIQLNGGWRNVFMGVFSGSNTTTGSYNSFYGAETGLQNTSGYNNSIFGYRTGNSITIANSNSFYGTESGLTDTSGSNNCFFGYQSGYENKNGNNNVYVGYASGHNSFGSGNVFLGFASGMNETGSNKLYITNTLTDATTSLIYGEFDNKILNFNAKVNVNDVINLTPRNTPPTGPVEGDMYMDSVSHKLFVFDGTIWQACW